MLQQDRFSAWPRFFFFTFFLVLVFATFFFSPGWGFMDDWQCGQTARLFWQGDLSWSSLINNDLHNHGRFRPVYHLWIISVYWIRQPLVLYLLVLAIGGSILLAWGRVIDRLFPQPSLSSFNRFLYPLTFFLFLPFWNIFMYISVQEKFVFVFGALSLLFLARSYQSGRMRDFIFSVVLAILAMLGKETGLAFLAAYGAFAFFDVCLFKTNRKRSLILLGLCLVLGVGYIAFMKGILGGYTQGYKSNLDVMAFVNAFRNSPSMIKAILAAAVGAGFWVIIDFVRGKKDFHPLFLICPFWVVSYVVLLLPWGFPHYLLAPLAPFVMMCGYYMLYRLFLSRQRWVLAVRIGIVVCVLAVLCGEILPRMSKMADKRKVIEELVSLNAKAPGKFFYPPVYEETAQALERFSSVKVYYTGLVTADDLDERGANYLVINDEASGMSLRDVSLGKEIYRSGTWLIRNIEKHPGAREIFHLELSKNTVQKLKGFLTSH